MLIVIDICVLEPSMLTVKSILLNTYYVDVILDGASDESLSGCFRDMCYRLWGYIEEKPLWRV